MAMTSRMRRWSVVFAVGVLPFTLTACPGNGDDANVEDVVPEDGEGGGDD